MTKEFEEKLRKKISAEEAETEKFLDGLKTITGDVKVIGASLKKEGDVEKVKITELGTKFSDAFDMIIGDIAKMEEKAKILEQIPDELAKHENEPKKWEQILTKLKKIISDKKEIENWKRHLQAASRTNFYQLYAFLEESKIKIKMNISNLVKEIDEMMNKVAEL